ncbi:hypothetical protein RMSM_00880 [Rhodopirellula maiorica SM1]|uniref:Uncharacterized protein n=1 Tax=Rhodopirellula maiorica SM1 TaxID=1265738 RepID=M5S3I0_9BACT|nr:hypothetical protein RMSM_00880 [Rhodopirellula maiorica SM1]
MKRFQNDSQQRVVLKAIANFPHNLTDLAVVTNPNIAINPPVPGNQGIG